MLKRDRTPDGSSTSQFRFPNALRQTESGTGKPIKFRDQKPIGKRDPAHHSSRDGLVALARRENLTVRQLAQIAGSYGGFQIAGTPADIADMMQEWLETEASDGFNVMFHTVPSGLHEFVDLVVPELQRRGLFRREYEGATLREHLGLPRPDNQFFPLGRASKAT